jgi:hypothetical protein
METKVINTWKEWGVICFTPMLAIDTQDKSIRMSWIIVQIEINL